MDTLHQVTCCVSKSSSRLPSADQRAVRTQPFVVLSASQAGGWTGKHSNFRLTRTESPLNLFDVVFASCRVSSLASPSVNRHIFGKDRNESPLGCGEMAKIKDLLLRCDSETYLVNLIEERKLRRQEFRAISTRKSLDTQTSLGKQRCCRDTSRHFGEIRLV